ncbi:hypothetical protein Dda3937_01630 [Dickeya dadantii 3937]|uniref:Uncharacterized protein n=1 Tax=Dickeya dadantii (strain 3937) TaxID=198628 RepID=E0SCJ9_DICD3|nr:hypothetical protein Dda3937_01630 [Dickeya dadantii 3937]
MFFYQCDSVNFYRNSVALTRHPRFSATIGSPPRGIFPTRIRSPCSALHAHQQRSRTQSRLYTPFAASLGDQQRINK